MYTAFLLLMAGFFLLSSHLLLLLSGIAMMVAILYGRTPLEEAMLLQHFGKEYAEYQKRTGLLLPRL